MTNYHEYYSFEKTLILLGMDEEELKRLVEEGQIRAFKDENRMKFLQDDIHSMMPRKDPMREDDSEDDMPEEPEQPEYHRPKTSVNTIVYSSHAEARSIKGLQTADAAITKVDGRYDPKNDKFQYSLNLTGMVGSKAQKHELPLNERSAATLCELLNVSHPRNLQYQRVTMYMDSKKVKAVGPRKN